MEVGEGKFLWFEGGIDLPEGATELDETAINQLYQRIATFILEERPDLSPDELTLMTEQLAIQFIFQLDYAMRGGFTEETNIPLGGVARLYAEEGEK